jgi:hypothetical protein
VVFALVSYFTAVTGKSDIGTFAGNALHGHAGGLLLRKIGSNLGSLSVNMFSPLIPIVVVVTGLKTMPLYREVCVLAFPRVGPIDQSAWSEADPVRA